jgi:hypothetical protein
MTVRDAGAGVRRSSHRDKGAMPAGSKHVDAPNKRLFDERLCDIHGGKSSARPVTL